MNALEGPIPASSDGVAKSRLVEVSEPVPQPTSRQAEPRSTSSHLMNSVAIGRLRRPMYRSWMSPVLH